MSLTIHIFSTVELLAFKIMFHKKGLSQGLKP